MLNNMYARAYAMRCIGLYLLKITGTNLNLKEFQITESRSDTAKIKQKLETTEMQN